MHVCTRGRRHGAKEVHWLVIVVVSVSFRFFLFFIYSSIFIFFIFIFFILDLPQTSGALLCSEFSPSVGLQLLAVRR